MTELTGPKMMQKYGGAAVLKLISTYKHADN